MADLMIIDPASRQHALDLINFIDASPSPWQAVESMSEHLLGNGFELLSESDQWKLEPGHRYFTVRGGSSLIAFVQGQDTTKNRGLRIVGAHTDSPGLRLKPKAAFNSDSMIRIGVEVYGSPILATFTDRDLSLAGRVNIRSVTGFDTKLLKIESPLLRLPNLAIHMNREVNEKGLKLNRQIELPLILGATEEHDANTYFLSLIANHLNIEPKEIITFDLNVYDTQKGILWGANEEYVANSQLDNLASCHAALNALVACENPDSTCLCAFFDHEEVGSDSALGANGSFLTDIIQRIGISNKLDEQSRLCSLSRSFFISADMAHAYNPNFPSAYEPCHHALINNGPVIKTNVNQRYSTASDTAAHFMQLCEMSDVPFQQYAHRSDLGCGSTIGPIIAARLGVPSVDVGSAMWAMHSLRESAGVLDHSFMIKVMKTHFTQ